MEALGARYQVWPLFPQKQIKRLVMFVNVWVMILRSPIQ